MAYTKQNYADGQVLTASQLNAMDDQIAANESALSGKQDKINDLDTIRSGAAAGATALQSHQSLKTINNQSLVGSGNITIEGGSGSSYDDSPVRAVVETVNIGNLFDNTTASDGYMNYNGSVSSSSSYAYNSFNVNAGDKIYCWAFDTSAVRSLRPRFICAKDANGNVLTQYGDYTGNSEIPYVVADTVKQLTFSVSKSLIGKFVVLKNTATAPTAYFNGSTNKYYVKTDAVNGRFYRKKIAAIGDSITAQHMWYSKLEDYLNANITNCGVGGSKVSGSAGFTSDDRINAIPSDTELVFVMGGMNDWAQNVALGEKKLSNTNVDTFYGAANVLVQKLYERVPNAKVICLGCTYGMFPDREGFTDTTGIYNNQGLTSIEYGRALCDMFRLNGIESFVVGEECGWNANNISTYVQNDGAYLHPNADGGALMADVIIRHLR